MKGTKTITKHRTKLDGKTWLRYSISVWDDIEKNPEERALHHPAMFPTALVERLLDCYLWDEGIVLDPFLGSGSTLVAARNQEYSGIGFEIVPDFAKLSLQRLTARLPFDGHEGAVQLVLPSERVVFEEARPTWVVVHDDARAMEAYLEPNSISILITSPPYWGIHRRARTADYKKPRPYSEMAIDLGNIESYEDFLGELKKVFISAYRLLKPAAYCIINVMDLRYGASFIPYHVDIMNQLVSIGFTLEDIIIWNRVKEYNNLRPLGYPHKFIVNKVHEYVLVFRRLSKGY
jgi:DNA modification methylase